MKMIKISETDHTRLKTLAASRGMTMKDYVSYIIETIEQGIYLDVSKTTDEQLTDLQRFIQWKLDLRHQPQSTEEK